MLGGRGIFKTRIPLEILSKAIGIDLLRKFMEIQNRFKKQKD